jgi:hypothetical protein
MFALLLLCCTEQAGVGLMLAEEPNGTSIIVKQLVPRGSADRSGKVRIKSGTLLARNLWRIFHRHTHGRFDCFLASV